MNDRIEYRFVSLSDQADWLSLWNAYLTPYDVDLPDDITSLTWRRFLDIDEPLHCISAYAEGRMVGFCTHVLHRSTWAKGHYCHLEDLFVSPSHRGFGIAQKLVELTHQAAKDHGCSRLYWVTQSTNEIAQRLYDKLAEKTGFIQYRMPIVHAK
jgi:GNAT superfamily N-acetyltransferase